MVAQIAKLMLNIDALASLACVKWISVVIYWLEVQKRVMMATWLIKMGALSFVWPKKDGFVQMNVSQYVGTEFEMEKKSAMMGTSICKMDALALNLHRSLFVNLGKTTQTWQFHFNYEILMLILNVIRYQNLSINQWQYIQNWLIWMEFWSFSNLLLRKIVEMRCSYCLSWIKYTLLQV